MRLLTCFLIGVSVWGANSLTITEKGGVTTTNYPVQIGRAFAVGEITNCPQAIIDGTPATTQADVKNRWNDGTTTVKFAVIAFLIPTLTANSTVTITFQNQTCSNTPLTQSQMLAAGYDFQAEMDVTVNSIAASVKARDILTAWDGSTDSNITGLLSYWTKGQVAQTVILADDSASRAYDFGWKDKKYTTPTANVTSTATSISVLYASDLTPPAVIKWDNEQICVSAVPNSTTYTVGTGCPGTASANGRGWNSTTAAAHTHVQNPATYIQTTAQASSYEAAPIAAYKSVRPRFIATFWPTINKVHVRFIGEMANPSSLQNIPVDTSGLALKIGNSSPSTAYNPAKAFKFFERSRWTRENYPAAASMTLDRGFWMGTGCTGTACNPSMIEIDPNYAYLESTTLLPNYDIADTTKAAGLTNTYITNTLTSWVAAARDIYDAGDSDGIGGSGDTGSSTATSGVTKSQGNSGNRWDIGPLGGQESRWIYKPDYRLWAIVQDVADMHASFPTHLREDDGTRKMTRPSNQGCREFYGSTAQCDVSDLGRVMAVTARKSSRVNINSSNWSSTDQIYPVGAYAISWGTLRDGLSGGPNPWEPDTDHAAEHFFLEYMMTGDPFYLEEEQFRVAWDAMWPNAQSVSSGRGPLNAGYMGIPLPTDATLQVRWVGWALRQRSNAAVMSADGTPEKAFFETGMNDAFATMEGSKNITGTTLYNDPWYGPANPNGLWQWAKNVEFSTETPTISPLHLWAQRSQSHSANCPTNATCAWPQIDATVANFVIQTFESDYLMGGMYRSSELGYNAGPTLSWASQFFINAILDPTYNKWTLVANGIPSMKTSGTSFATLTDAASAFRLGAQSWASNDDVATNTLGLSYYGQYFVLVGNAIYGQANTLNPGLTCPVGGGAANGTCAWTTHVFPNYEHDTRQWGVDQAKWDLVPRFTITTFPLPNGTVSVAYSQTITATGGTTPYTFSVVAGSLPAGITLSSGGVLSGTPSAAGISTFTVQAADSASGIATAPFQLTIQSSGLSISPTTPITFSIISAMSPVTFTASGGTAPYTYSVSAGQLPTGITLNGATGVLSGTATKVGAFSFTVRATDSLAAFVDQPITLTVTNFGTTILVPRILTPLK